MGLVWFFSVLFSEELRNRHWLMKCHQLTRTVHLLKRKRVIQLKELGFPTLTRRTSSVKRSLNPPHPFPFKASDSLPLARK